MLKIIGCVYCLIGFVIMVLDIINFCAYRAASDEWHVVEWSVKDAVLATIGDAVLWPFDIVDAIRIKIKYANADYEYAYSEKSDL